MTTQINKLADAAISAINTAIDASEEASRSYDEGTAARELIALGDYPAALACIEDAARSAAGNDHLWKQAVEAVKVVRRAWSAACDSADDALAELAKEEEAAYLDKLAKAASRKAARKAKKVAPSTITPVTISGWYELTDGRVQWMSWSGGQLRAGVIVANWAAAAKADADEYANA